MQDLKQGNYMVCELARIRRKNGRCSFYVIEVRMRRERSLVATVAFIFASQEVASLPSQTIRSSRQNLRVYRHNAIAVLTMNNAIVVRPESLVRN